MSELGAEGGGGQMTAEEHMGRILNELQVLSSDIEASAVVSRDGSILGSTLPLGVDADRLSSMFGALLSLADRTARENGKENPYEVKIKDEDGYVLMIRVNDDTTLAAMTKPEAKVGLVFYDLRNTSKELARVLGNGGM